MTFPVPPGVGGLIGAVGQTWRDRLREAAYTSPTGTRIPFLYEDVSRSTGRRQSEFHFTGVNGTYVQDHGYKKRNYPLRVFFTGDRCDIEALAFEAALLEPGLGKLEHPMYRTIENVLPLGDWTRRDDLKEAANQVVIEVTFSTTLVDLFPSAAAAPQSEIITALGAFDVTAAQEFADSADLASTISQANIKGTIRKQLQQISASLQSVSDATADVRREFADINSLINESLDVLIGQPLLLMQQMAELIKAPGRALAGIASRLESYAALAERIFGSSEALPAQALAAGAEIASRVQTIANNFHQSNFVASQAVAGSVLSAVEASRTRVDLDNIVAITGTSDSSLAVAASSAGFISRAEALRAAQSIRDQFDAWVTWNEAGFAALGAVSSLGTYQADTGGTYQALQKVVAQSVALLISNSFGLRAERRVVLGRPRTIIDLTAELYGTVDRRLDLLIQTNQLTGEEMLELPRGKSIVYYN